MQKSRLKFGLMLFAIVLAFAATALPQTGSTDQGGLVGALGTIDGPLQIGFAVITPQNGTPIQGSNPLNACQTFGQNGGCNGTTQAGVLGAPLVTSGFLPFLADLNLSRDLGLAIVNPNPTPVNVTFTLRDLNGTDVGDQQLTIPANWQRSLFLSQRFVGNTSFQGLASTGTVGLKGTMIFQASGPVAVVGLRFQGQNFSKIPVLPLSGTYDVPVMQSGIGGPGAILLPQVVVGQGWGLRIVVTNSNANSAQSFRVDLFNSNGTPMIAILNGQSSATFQDLTASPNSAFFLSNQNADGSTPF
jgi:hypothetical protein